MKTRNEKCKDNRDLRVEVKHIPTQRAISFVRIILSAIVIVRHCDSNSLQILDVRPHTHIQT
jgi:hypothetical protein